MEAGALGTETGDESDGLLRITGYFAETPDRERVRNELFEALRIYDLPSSSVRDMNVREVAEHDWLEEWKQNWQPVEIGRFIIAPPWSNLGEIHDRLIIRIEPGHGVWHGHSRNHSSLSRRNSETFCRRQFSRCRHRHRDSRDCGGEALSSTLVSKRVTRTKQRLRSRARMRRLNGVSGPDQFPRGFS